MDVGNEPVRDEAAALGGALGAQCGRRSPQRRPPLTAPREEVRIMCSTPASDSRGDRGHVLLDGSRGEGGGQILRTALTLSLLTGRPFRMVKIRANRDKPGLRPQHQTAVEAAAELGDARVDRRRGRLARADVFARQRTSPAT